MIVIEGKNHDLGGGMVITRILPHINKRAIGPFVFFDHMGPLIEKADQNTDVRPHPHIGLSTLTYLFEGRIVHRDSTGAVASITPGEVNWMTAGSGVSHSERAHPDDKHIDRKIHGLQFWIALPEELEEIEPSFLHYENDSIPFIEKDQFTMKLIAGKMMGYESPVKISSPLIFSEFKVLSLTDFDFSEIQFELGAYLISGELSIGDVLIKNKQMVVLDKLEFNKVKAKANTHFVIIGGEPLKSPRHLYWNFVSSNKERIEKAKNDWSNGKFPMVPGEKEFIPLPGATK